MPRDVLWTLVKGEHSQSAAVRSGNHGDVELLLSQDRTIYFRHLYATRSLAAAQADHVRSDLESTGWTATGVDSAQSSVSSTHAETADGTSRAANYDYTRDDAHHRIRVTVHKPLWTDEALAIVDRQAAERTWDYPIVYDLRPIEGVYVVPNVETVLQRVEQYANRLGPRAPVVVIARRPTLARATRTYHAITAKAAFHVEVFWNPVDAERWLDDFDARAHTR